MAITMRRFVRMLGACLLVALLLASCGGPQAVTITLKDTSIEASPDSFAAGPITFHVTNTSATETHEFVIIQTDLKPEQLPTDKDGSVLEDQLTSPGEKGDMAAGQTADLTLTLPAGQYMFICNLPNHFKEGMHTSFTVK